MEVTTIRQNNLRRLVERHDSQLAFATAAGLSVQYLSQLLWGHRNLGEKAARKIEKALGLAPGHLDWDEAAGPASPMAALPADQQQLLANYARLSPAHQGMILETVMAYLKLERELY